MKTGEGDREGGQGVIELASKHQGGERGREEVCWMVEVHAKTEISE